MPLSFQDFVRVLQSAPAGATDDHIISAAKEAEGGGPLGKIWETVNRPLAGSADALIPALRHEHGDDESTLRRTAEDFGASLSSPFNLALTGLGLGAGAAGRAGALGISKAARAG